jgi:hypothetical protein
MCTSITTMFTFFENMIVNYFYPKKNNNYNRNYIAKYEIFTQQINADIKKLNNKITKNKNELCELKINIQKFANSPSNNVIQPMFKNYNSELHAPQVPHMSPVSESIVSANLPTNKYFSKNIIGSSEIVTTASSPSSPFSVSHSSINIDSYQSDASDASDASTSSYDVIDSHANLP